MIFNTSIQENLETIISGLSEKLQDAYNKNTPNQIDLKKVFDFSISTGM